MPSDVGHQSCDWSCERRIVERIDADARLAAGTSPLGTVLGAAKTLSKDGACFHDRQSIGATLALASSIAPTDTGVGEELG